MDARTWAGARSIEPRAAPGAGACAGCSAGLLRASTDSRGISQSKERSRKLANLLQDLAGHTIAQPRSHDVDAVGVAKSANDGGSITMCLQRCRLAR